jgi:hypothetical protein
MAAFRMRYAAARNTKEGQPSTILGRGWTVAASEPTRHGANVVEKPHGPIAALKCAVKGSHGPRQPRILVTEESAEGVRIKQDGAVEDHSAG